jgi:putative ubiquitin-RnfH superfamily antitoxin RatB of RatAB toxin-antitoxin module
MHVSIVYALPDEQWVEALDVPEGCTVEQAVHMSQLSVKFPEVDLAINKVGIFAKLVKLTQVLTDGERVEVYRALPKKPRDAHANDDKKERIRAKKDRQKPEE